MSREGIDRTRVLASLAMLGLLAFAFIGRCVLSSDGGEVLSDTLGFLTSGRFQSASMPPEYIDPNFPPAGMNSRYGLFPSLVPLPFLAVAWPFRGVLGARGVDAVVALTWAAGAALAALSFLRLARGLRHDVSALWAPAFVGGTFLWPYAADSFMEPWAAAALAFSAGTLLRVPKGSPAVHSFLCAAGWVAACWLKPVLWITVPVFVLTALLVFRREAQASTLAVALLGFLCLGLAGAGLVNLARYGALTDVGYGYTGALPFINPLGAGVLGLTVMPGRGVIFYAPIVLGSLFAFRRLSPEQRVLCFGVPLVHLLIVCRWYGWQGGSAWGPRYLLSMLPFLAAPAVLLPRAVSAGLLGIGFFVNLPGVLVSSGAFQSYTELLRPPPGVVWPSSGGDRVSLVPSLSPITGHAWLLAGSITKDPPSAPWLRAGATEVVPRPPLAAFLSPLLVRRAVGLPPVSPFVQRLLVRSALAYLVRGMPADAARLSEEALRIAPGERDAVKILADARAAVRAGHDH